MKIVLLFIVLMLCSCVKNVDKVQQRFVLTEGEQIELETHCAELSQYGEYSDLLQQIHEKTDFLLEELELVNSDSDSDVNELYLLSEEIRSLIKKVSEMLDPKYGVAKFKYELLWTIEKKDFEDLLGVKFKKGFRLLDIDLVGASSLGERKDELLKQLIIQKSRTSVAFAFNGVGSSLELCQLARTRIFMVDVHYKNIINHNYRRFNLIMR